MPMPSKRWLRYAWCIFMVYTNELLISYNRYRLIKGRDVGELRPDVLLTMSETGEFRPFYL